jgi:tetratricopeptide (TPR) repeat protein
LWLGHDETRHLRLIMDGFERIQGTERRMDTQKRLQEVLGYFVASDAPPEAKRFRVVIFGRNRLRWDELYDDDEWKNFWNQHLLAGLGVEDARLFLESYARWLRDAGQSKAALTLENHVESILNAADERIEGKRQIYPFYLDLAVDQLQNCIRKGVTPDFGKTPTELQERFLKYLGEAEERALMILALAEAFDEPLYDWLAKERLIALPVGAFHSALRRDHSYFERVQKAGSDSWKLHRKMEDVLQDRWLSSDALRAEGALITKRLIDFYGKKLESKPEKEWGSDEIEYWRRGMEILTSQGPERALLAETDWGRTTRRPWACWWPLPVGDGIAFARRALAGYEKAFGLEHPETAESLDTLALLCMLTNDYAKAEPLYQRALKIREKAFGLEHPETANSLYNLACLYIKTNDYAKAEPLLQRVLKIREKAFGSEHLEAAKSLDSLAWLYMQTNDYAKAELLLHRALKSGEHPETANCLEKLALLYMNNDDYAKVELLLQRALKIREKAFGPEHPETLASVIQLGHFLTVKGDLSAALAFLRSAAEKSEICMAAVRYHLARYECLSGNFNKAQELIAQEIADDPETRNSALEDPDLSAIHDYIRALPANTKKT